MKPTAELVGGIAIRRLPDGTVEFQRPAARGLVLRVPKRKPLLAYHVAVFEYLGSDRALRVLDNITGLSIHLAPEGSIRGTVRRIRQDESGVPIVRDGEIQTYEEDIEIVGVEIE